MTQDAVDTDTEQPVHTTSP